MTLKQAHCERRQEILAGYFLKAAVPLTNNFKVDEFLRRKTEIFSQRILSKFDPRKGFNFLKKFRISVVNLQAVGSQLLLCENNLIEANEHV